jgi:hypothetical protein
MNFSFSQLSLSGVQAAAGVAVLAPGRYVCKVKDVEFVDNKNKNGKLLKVKLVCKDGVITDNINVFHETPKAQEIGQEQLKALLVNGGHPDPDNIGQHGIPSIKGLEVGVIVIHDTYNGQPSSRVGGYTKPDAIGQVGAHGSVAAKPAPAASFGGDIPFILNATEYEMGTSKQRRMGRYDY